MDSQCIWMTLAKDGFGKKKIPVTSSIAADFAGRALYMGKFGGGVLLARNLGGAL